MGIDRVAIKSVIEKYYPQDVKKYLEKEYVLALPEYFGEQEILEGVLFGAVPDLIGSTSGGLWATDRRLLFLSTHIFGKSLVDFTYEKIEGITMIPSWPRSVVIKTSGANNFMLQSVDNEIATKFTNRVREIMENRKSNKQDQKIKPTEGDDFISQLERLANLRKVGAIDEVEFNLAKKKLLDHK